MYSTENLDNIYDNGQDINDPGASPMVPKTTLDRLEAKRKASTGTLSNTPNSDDPLRGGQELFDPRPYAGYMDGVPQHRLGEVDEMRGQMQSNSEKLGNALFQTGAKTLTQLGDMAGSMVSLFTEWGDNRDYENGLTSAAEAANEWIDNNFPLYRSDNSTFAPGDLSWWLQNGVGLTSSMAGFAVGGMGIAAGMKGLATLTKVGQLAEAGIGAATNAYRAAKIMNRGTETLHAGLLAYAEGAQVGSDVFNTVYRNRLVKGYSEETARHLAAQAASTTVQLNTIINGGLNLLGGVSEFFNHQTDKVLTTAKQRLAREVGEGTEQYLKRLRNSSAKDFEKELGLNSSPLSSAIRKDNLLTAGKEAFAEGMEEVTNQFAQKTGEEEGNKGKIHGFFEQLGQLGHYLDRTADTEGLLNFALGAVAGPGSHMVTHTLPVYKVQTGEDGQGNPTYYEDGKRVNYLTKQDVMVTQSFNNIRDRLKSDLENIERKKANLKTAVANGEVHKAEEIRSDIFNLMNKNAVLMGMGSNLKETYKSIGELDNEKTDTEEATETLNKLQATRQQLIEQGQETSEIDDSIVQQQEILAQTKNKTAAQLLGFASEAKTKEHAEKAKRAIEDIEELQRIYDKVQTKYGFDTNPASPEGTLNNFVFARKADVYLTEKELGRHKEELAKLDSENASPIDVEDEASLYNSASQAKAREVERARMKALSLEEDIQNFNEFLKSPTDSNWSSIEDLALKYGAFGTSKSDRKEVVSNLSKELKGARERAEKAFKDTMEADLDSEYFQQWKEKTGGTAQEYYKQLSKKYSDSAYHKNLAKHVETLENRLSFQKQMLAKLDSASTISRVLSKAGETQRREREELMKHLESIAAEERELIETDIQKQRAYKNLIEKLKVEHSKKLTKTLENISKIKPQLEELLEKLKNPELRPYDVYTLRTEARKLEQELEQNTKTLERLTDLLETLKTEEIPEEETSDAVPTPPPPPPPMSEAFSAYLNKLGTLVSNDAKIVVEIVRAQVENDKMPFSLNALRNVKGIPEDDGLQLMMLIKDYLKEKGKEIKSIEDTLKAAKDAETKAETAPTVEGTEEENLPTAMEAIHEGTPFVYLGGEDYQLAPAKTGFMGSRQLTPEFSGASKSTVFFTKAPDGKIIRTSTAILVPGHSLNVLHPNELRPGTKVTISFDEEYDGTVNDTEAIYNSKDKATPQKESMPFSNYLKDGKIDITATDGNGRMLINEIPIKIVDEDGKVIQWVHRVSWILQKIQGEFVNVVDITPEYPEGGNAVRAAEANKKLRIALAQLYNRGVKEIPITVESKSEGNIVANKDWSPASLHIRGNIQLGLVSSTGAEIIGGPEKPDYMDLKGWENRVVALLPGANGRFVPTSLRGKTLDQDMSAVHSIIRSLEVYLGNSDEKVPGYNIHTRKGIRNYLVQNFTYLTKAKDALTDTSKGVFIDILPEGLDKVRKAQIIQKSDLGIKVTDLELGPEGKLTATSRLALLQLLKARYRSVAITNTENKIKGLNSPDPFNEVTYDPKEERWNSVTRQNYNRFLLNHLESKVTFAKDGESEDGIPTYKDAKGEASKFYPYLVNPIVSYDMSSVFDMADVMKSAAIPITTEQVTKEVSKVENPQDFSTLILPDEYDYQREHKSVGTTESSPITRDSLQNLLNFTPLSERNSRSVEDMLEYYKTIGVTHLPPGYNPFKEC